jgi:hypothetical protein
VATKIMIIRHAEKPADDHSIHGVSENGEHDPDELSVRGWQRSGALVRFFAPRDGLFSKSELAVPSVIFACAATSEIKSLRSQHTVLALSAYLNRALNLRHTKGQEQALVEDALAVDGAVLISWEHKGIPEIANRLLGNDATSPQKWPDSRFDVVWVFDRQSRSEWHFTQLAQMLLPGDLDYTI